MELKTIGDKKIIKLAAQPKNTYSIISLTLFALLMAICIGTILYFGESPVKAFGILFIPLALLVFLLKVVVWNLFGTETIVLHKKSLESTFDYRFIYKMTHKRIPFEKFQLKLRANSTTELLNVKEAIDKEYKYSKFKIQFLFSKGDKYQSSISINQKELEEIVDLIRT